MNRVVDRLTAEQYRVLSHLQQVRRVRISGSAGSGKTLVALEKASRMAKGGQNVLFLCHNPLLARHVATLAAGTGVNVVDFGSWIAQLLGEPWIDAGAWHVYEEPDQATLDRATQALAGGQVRYDGIIVDEAQDFRDAWWKVVELALRPDGVFYLFYDNNQSLLPHRGDYPSIEPPIILSRNCRNAGRIFELMRYFDGALPETEELLEARGNIRLTLYEPGEEASNLATILAEIKSALHITPVILWSGPETVVDSPLLGLEIRVAEGSWHDHVQKAFQRLLSMTYRPFVVSPHDAESRIDARLRRLSRSRFPTESDVDIISGVAKSFSFIVQPADHPGSAKRREREQSARELLTALQSGNWVEDLPHSTFQTAAFNDPLGAFRVRVFGVPDFKGLEAEAVILVMRGRATSHRQATYVGISRARALLWILADRTAAVALPPDFAWDAGWPEKV